MNLLLAIVFFVALLGLILSLVTLHALLFEDTKKMVRFGDKHAENTIQETNKLAPS